MAIISKYDFERAARDGATCKDVLHPWTNSCLLSALHLAAHVGFGSSRFWVAIYALQTIINWKKVNVDYVRRKAREFLRSMAYGALYAFLFMSYNCFTRKFTNNFKYYNVVFMAGICGGLSIFLESKENRLLDTIVYSNLVAETLIRWFDYTDILIRNRKRDTCIFMLFSSALMYLIKTRGPQTKATNIWFFYPSAINTTNEEAKCYHKNECSDHILKASFRYFLIGYAIQYAKTIVSHFDRLIFRPLKMIKIAYAKKTISMGLFLGSYVGLYKLISCLLYKKDKKETPQHAIIAGFLAGISYSLQPSLSIAAIALTTTIQMSLQRIPKFDDCNRKYPTKELLFALCSGILFHIRFLHPDCCPRYVINMFDVGTNGQVPIIYNNVLQFAGINNIMPSFV